jgi:hypothetical protein
MAYTLEDLLNRKDVTCLVNYIPKDGRPFEAYEKKPNWKYRRLRHDTVSYELQKKVENILGYGGISFCWICNEEPDAWELIVRVKKGSRMEKAYLDLGFGEI